MYTIVSNEQDAKLSNLDIDIVKSTRGIYNPYEIIEMMNVYFYDKMVIDVTALKDYTNIDTYRELINLIDPEKVVLFIPEGNAICTPTFMAQLIAIGIYNFTTNTDGVKYLLKKSNKYSDVANIIQMASGLAQQQTPPPPPQPQIVQPVAPKPVQPPVEQQIIINRNIRLGIRNVTEHAGATSLTYMLKKELASIYGENKVVAIEVNKNEFQFFNDSTMISSTAANLRSNMQRLSGMKVILIDLNDYPDNTVCDDIIYLIEPSTLSLNKLIRRNKNIFAKLRGKKIILNKSLLSAKDVNELEHESGLRFIYNLPPVNDRKRNEVINDFIAKLGLINSGTNEKDSGRIFGLFRR